MGCTETTHGGDGPEEIVEHIAPMTKHIENDAAAIGLTIVPARSLRRRSPIALEDPVAEFAAHREDATEETAIPQHAQLQQSGQEQLVLHHTMFEPRSLGLPGKSDCGFEVVADGLFAIDMLARRKRLADELGAHLRRASIEENRIVGIAQGFLKIDRPARYTVLVCDALNFFRVASDEDGIGHEAVAVPEQQPAGVAYREDRPDEVLIVPHTAGNAVHDQSEAPLRHRWSSLVVTAWLLGYTPLRWSVKVRRAVLRRPPEHAGSR